MNERMKNIKIKNCNVLKIKLFNLNEFHTWNGEIIAKKYKIK